MFKSWNNMSKSFMVLSAFVAWSAVSFSLPGTSSALLISELGGQLVLDTNTNEVWVTNLNQFSNMNYTTQVSVIAALSFSGYTGFHMASLSEVETLVPYGPTAIFAAPFIPNSKSNPQYLWGRTSTPDWVGPNGPLNHWDFIIFNDVSGAPFYSPLGASGFDINGNDPADPRSGAWVVGTPIPEPCTFILLGTGMAGLASSRLRRRKK